jgi:hypothetical protein
VVVELVTDLVVGEVELEGAVLVEVDGENFWFLNDLRRSSIFSSWILARAVA